MIDICDYAVGLSRQLFGLTIATERPDHRMMETWHPLGVVGVISAFNFPVAVWSWNAALAFVCGDAVVWKPSEKTPLTALAVQALVRARRGERFGDVPDGPLAVLIGGREVGEALVDDRRVPLVSRHRLDAPWAAQVGAAARRPLRPRAPRARRQQRRHRRALGRPRPRPARHRLRRHGHRRASAAPRCAACSSTRASTTPRAAAEGGLRLGRRSATRAQTATLVGPLIDEAAFDGMQRALDEARAAGGDVTGGERVEPAPRRGASMSARRWSRCRRRPTSCSARPSRRSSTS